MTILFETIQLKNQIFQLKKKLINVEKQKGSTHPKTIKYRKELDKLVTKFHSITID